MSYETDRKLNFSMMASGEAIDLSATDYEPGRSFTIFVGVGGDVKVDLAEDGDGLTYENQFDGTWMPIVAKKVYKTGTTATNLKAGW